MSLFQKSVVNKYLKNLHQQTVQEAYKQFQQFYDDAERIENIRLLKEENYQEGFLREIFVDVLGYTINPNKNYNLTTEYKNETDSKKADGAILQDEKAIGVIELKSTKTPDLESIRDQAFNYKNNQTNCRYVITSNFEKLRFYIDNATDWEEFNLFHLDFDNFCKLYLFLSKESIFNGITAKLKEESKLHEEDITGKLYKDYSLFKQQLFADLIKHNPTTDKLLLFHKSQKLLDRILFVLFAEDRGLLPPNAITRIIEQWEKLKELDEEKSLYSRFVKLFHHLDEGHKYKDYELPAYNGGLFKKDDVLDSLIISDSVLNGNTIKLSAYDYNTEVDVNVLGHIFENSITEIEQVKAEIEGTQSDKNRSRRKKEGIFYTPKYITKYIVDNTVGALCSEKKKELGILEIENEIIENSRTSKGKLTKKAGSLLQKLNNYRAYLSSLKILDPACGSGAFLNQALEFLINEHELIDSYRRELEQDSLGLYDITKSILENNLYGVDINEEAVEIAKLSLWIRTAEKGRKLSDLNKNIKCGNSLIDDPAVAGDKAFNWDNEFPEIISNGGFDVVIGNPPYVRAELISNKSYLSKIYLAGNNSADIYTYFFEKGYLLLRLSGKLGFITSNTFLRTGYGKDLRNFLKNNITLNYLYDFGDSQFFKGASTRTAITIFSKTKLKSYEFKYLELEGSKLVIDFSHIVLSSTSSVNNLNLDSAVWSFKDISTKKLIDRLYKSFDNFDKYTNGSVKRGIVTGFNKAFIIDQKKRAELINSNHKCAEIIKLWITGNDITKWVFNTPKEYLIFTRRGIDIAQYPEVKNYLLTYYDDLKPKDSPNEEHGRKPGKYAWYEIQDSIDYFEELKKPKIIFANMAQSNRFAIDESGGFINQKAFFIPFIDYHLISILNSKLIFLFVKSSFPRLLGSTYEFTYKNHMEKIPIPSWNQDLSPSLELLSKEILQFNKEYYHYINTYLSRLLSNFNVGKLSNKLKEFYIYDFKTFLSELKKKKITLTLKQQDEWEQYFNEYKAEINKLQHQISQTDKEIDQLVYKLYGLTPEEIKIVEESSSK